MLGIDYWRAKVRSKILKSNEPMASYYRQRGVKIGNGCLICSNILSRESSLIEIGNNVTISTNVTLITHDNCVKLVHPDKTDLFGKIKIGNNCFIGENATLLYGITIADNTIVAAGSVVCKSIQEEGTIVGGNPARKIGTFDEFMVKTESKAICRSELQDRLAHDDSFLIIR